MVHELSNNPWLVYGDFNMVEFQEDKEGAFLACLLIREKET
jgi:hypothetical protein